MGFLSKSAKIAQEGGLGGHHHSSTSLSGRKALKGWGLLRPNPPNRSTGALRCGPLPPSARGALLFGPSSPSCQGSELTFRGGGYSEPSPKRSKVLFTFGHWILGQKIIWPGAWAWDENRSPGRHCTGGGALLSWTGRRGGRSSFTGTYINSWCLTFTCKSNRRA